MDCRLILVHANSEDSFTPKLGETTIGRDTDNDIQLVYESISRHHAKLVNLASVCEIEDLNSSNGTYVQGERISEKCLLQHGDEIKMGDCMLRFEEAKRSSSSDDTANPRDYTDRSQFDTLRLQKHPSATASPESSVKPLKPLKPLSPQSSESGDKE